MKKIVFLLLMPVLALAQVPQPKSTTTFSNILATGNLTVNGTSLLKGAVTTNTSLTVGGKIMQGSLTYTDNNVWISSQGSSNNYYQAILQNSSNGNQASTDFVASNDQGTATTYYGNFGMNSSTYTGSAVFSQPNAVYLTAQNGDMCIGTTSNNAINFAVNNSSLTAMKITTAGNLNVANSSTFTGQATLSNSLNILGNTTLITNATKTITTGNTGTLAVLSDALIPVAFTTNTYNPVDATTYFMGNVSGYSPQGVSYGAFYIPYNATLIGWTLNSVQSNTNASAETTTLQIAVNGSTTNLSTSITFSATSGINTYTATGLSQNVSAGDKIEPKLVSPTWATNPLAQAFNITFWFVRRQ
jgi:hypothetical protein